MAKFVNEMHELSKPEEPAPVAPPRRRNIVRRILDQTLKVTNREWKR